MTNAAIGTALALAVNVFIEVQDARTKQVLECQQHHNLFTLAGRNIVRDALNGVAGTHTITHFGIGTGSTAPAEGDTALETQVLRDTITKRTPTNGVLTLQYYLASTAVNGSVLREAGLFNASTGGTLFARVTHNPINKTSSTTVTYTWVITISAG